MLKILFLILSFSCALAQEATNDEEKMDVFRLPNNTEPISYELKISPFIEPKTNNFSFTGEVTINIRAITSTEELTLNSHGLNIEKIEVTDTSSSLKISTKHELVIKNQQLKIQLDKPGLIADREYNVQISYSGVLRDDMTGFYKSSYKDQETNEIKWLAVTQFEPTYARTAFPCYDEPAFKTPFKISITRRDTQMSLSNMPRYKFYQLPNSPSLSEIYICDEFPATEPISTYLVAFAVSEFVNTTGNQRIFVYTHKDYVDQVKYIKGRANKLLNMLEIYTNIPYQYSKLDLLAVPDSFGAMENWGLNTYREKYLLVSEKSSEKDKETVMTTVQHELAQQWFGNLVTCSWWNYVWLNKAFATLFEYFAVNVVEPNWRIGDTFIIEKHQDALGYDHRPKHPVTASVNSPDEIEDILDTITYNKGASILRMLKYTLTDDIFRTALSLYLKNNMFKSVEPKQLWSSFDNVLFEEDYKLGILGDTITVEEFMNSWTNQAGYPVVNVETNTQKNSIIISQKLFQVDEPKLNSTALWHIGLTYTTKNTRNFNNLQPSIWMNNTQNKIVEPLTEDEGWVLFNLQSTGFYRVNYDSRNWDLLIAEMKNNPKSIHVLNRAQLIDDSFNLARAGELSYHVPLTLITYLDKEDDFIPWYSVKNSMSYLVERLRRCSHTGPQMKNFTKQYAQIVYKKVKTLYDKNDTKHLTKTSMEAFSNWACNLEVESCVNSSLHYFNAWWHNKTEISPDIKRSVLCMGIKNGTEETWNTVFALFLNTTSASERQAALLALACSTNRTVLTKYMDFLLEKNCPIRPQDYKIMFDSLASTPVGINVTLEFLKNKINESLKYMWDGEEMIMEMYSTLASKVATSQEINELNAIKDYIYLSPKLKNSFDKSFKEVELNSAYYVRGHAQIHELFNPSKEPQTSSAISNSYSFINIVVLLLISVIPLLNNNNNFLFVK